MKFHGPSNPTMGKGGKTSYKSPASGEIRGMVSCGEGLMSGTNKTYARKANQGSKGGPNFKGMAGNPVNRGR